MVPRVFLVALVSVSVAAGCGSPTSPTRTSQTPTAASAPAAAPTALPPASGLPGSLKAEAASVVEFQYASGGVWTYAPQMRIVETSGQGAIRITAVEISIPGHTPWVCATYQHLAPGETRELFPEVYGDYPLTFDNPGHRSSGNVAIVVRFVDNLGQSGTLTVNAPITPGDLPPNTRAPKVVDWSCQGVT